jgi:hypothetical protein
VTPRPDTGACLEQRSPVLLEGRLGRIGLDERLAAHRQAPVLSPAIGGKEFHVPSPALAACRFAIR